MRHQPTGCFTGLEPGLAVDGTRDLEHGLAPPSRLGIEQPIDPVEPPPSYAGERRRLMLRQLRRTGHDLVAHGRLRKPTERNELAARADRVRQRADVVGDEHRHGVRRRLLEILEQRVGRLIVQRVRPEDEIDAPVCLERPHVQVVVQLADRVDPDLVAEGLEHVQIRMRAALDTTGIAEQRSREPERGAALPHARRPVEEVRVCRPLGQRSVEQAARLGLLRKALEACHAPPSRPLRQTERRRSS